jgi:hypothetical protein
VAHIEFKIKNFNAEPAPEVNVVIMITFLKPALPTMLTYFHIVY